MCEFLSTFSEMQMKNFLDEKNIALSPIEDDDTSEESSLMVEKIDENAFLVHSERTNSEDPEEEIYSFINAQDD